MGSTNAIKNHLCSVSVSFDMNNNFSFTLQTLYLGERKARKQVRKNARQEKNERKERKPK